MTMNNYQLAASNRKPVDYLNEIVEQVYVTIKANNANIMRKDLVAIYGQRNTDLSVLRLYAKNRIRRIKKLSDRGVIYVYKVLE